MKWRNAPVAFTFIFARIFVFPDAVECIHKIGFVRLRARRFCGVKKNAVGCRDKSGFVFALGFDSQALFVVAVLDAASKHQTCRNSEWKNVNPQCILM